MSCKASRQLHGAVEGISGIGAAAGIHVGPRRAGRHLGGHRRPTGRSQLAASPGRANSQRHLEYSRRRPFRCAPLPLRDLRGAEPLESRNLQEGRGFGPDHSLGADLGDRFRLSSTATRISGSNVRYRPSPLWPRPFRSVRTTACHPNRSSRRTSNPISSAPPTS